MKKPDRHIVGYCGSKSAVSHAGVNAYCGVSKNGHPKEGKSCGDEQHGGYEFSDRAAARNAGDEHSDKRRPGNPPRPIKQRPGIDPRRGLISIDVERSQNQGVQIQPDILYEITEKLARGAGQQHEDHQENGDNKVDLRQDAHTFIEAANDRNCCHQSNHRNHRQLDPQSDGEAKQIG